MNANFKIFHTLLCLICCSQLKAQEATVATNAPLRVAVLAPIYIDSAFDKFNYKLGSAHLPNYMIPGLDFYNGAVMGIDSLAKEHANVEVWIYDTRSSSKSIDDIVDELSIMNFSLVLASIGNAEEQKAISTFSFNHNIPVISCTYPNDADVESNPYYIVLNPTLKTQIEGIHDFVAARFASQKILYVTRTGDLENDIYGYFSAKDKRQPVNYKKLILTSGFAPESILSLLEKDKETVIVCGSMNESFVATLLHTLNASEQQSSVTVLGMPSWNTAKSFNLSRFPNIRIVSSTAFNYASANPQVAHITKKYKETYGANPTEMTYRGYECVYNFCKLLLKYNGGLINNLSDSSYKKINRFNIVPVKMNPDTFLPDYQENKNLYFISRQGTVEKEIK